MGMTQSRNGVELHSAPCGPCGRTGPNARNPADSGQNLENAIVLMVNNGPIV